MELKTYEIDLYVAGDVFTTITVEAFDEDSAVIRAAEKEKWEITQILEVREVEE